MHRPVYQHSYTRALYIVVLSILIPDCDVVGVHVTVPSDSSTIVSSPMLLRYNLLYSRSMRNSSSMSSPFQSEKRLPVATAVPGNVSVIFERTNSRSTYVPSVYCQTLSIVAGFIRVDDRSSYGTAQSACDAEVPQMDMMLQSRFRPAQSMALLYSPVMY